MIISRYAELDKLDHEIAVILAKLSPNDIRAKNAVETTKEKAEETQKATEESIEKIDGKFEPTEEIKELYRNVAKSVHPDLAVDEVDRERRNQIMSKVNPSL